MVRFEIMGDAVLVPGESWAMIPQPGIAGTEGVDPILDLSLNHIAGDFAGAAILRKLFGQVFDVKLKHAAARHLRAGQIAGGGKSGCRRCASQSRSSSSSPSMILTPFSIAFTPPHFRQAWVARPCTSTSRSKTPRLAGWMCNRVGSVTMAASAL